MAFDNPFVINDETTLKALNSVSPQNAPAVEVQNLVFSYKAGWRAWQEVLVLRNVTITVPQGKIYALLGPSGCGKTTLLRCVLGRNKPSAGIVRVFGKVPGRFLQNFFRAFIAKVHVET